MQLSPPAARPQAALLVKPFALAVHLQAGAIDEKMERLIASGPFGQDGHAAAATAQRGIIRNGDIDLEHLSDRSQHALGLTQRLVEHQPKHETRFYGQRRIDRLTAALSGRRGMPCRHRSLGEPYRQAAPPHQRGIAFVELVWHGYS